MHHTVDIQTEHEYCIEISDQQIIVLCCRIIETIIEYFFGLGCYCGYDISYTVSLKYIAVTHGKVNYPKGEYATHGNDNESKIYSVCSAIALTFGL